MPDGFELLRSQHRDVERLVDRYAITADERLARELCELLTRHTHLEEQALYPQLRRFVDGGDDLADIAESEHAALKALIARIRFAPPPDVRPLIEQLGRDAIAHMNEEEGRLFPEMEGVGIDAQELGRRLHAAADRTGSRSAYQMG